MGWKNIKEHYRIGHLVKVDERGICIGSSYISDIIVISLDGKIVKRYDERSNEELIRYQREMDADPETLRRLATEPDSFSASIPVFTYRGGEILEKQCEALEWPNVTHDGQMMYDNSHSPDKTAVVTWAKTNADYRIKDLERSVQDAEKRLTECRERLAMAVADRGKLERDYPEIPSEAEIEDTPEGAQVEP